MRQRRLQLFYIPFLVVTLWPTIGQLRAETANLPNVRQLQETLETLADEVRPSVVAIRAVRRIQLEENKPPGSVSGSQLSKTSRQPIYERIVPVVGSGFVFDGGGLVLTNEHVIQDARPEDIECTLSTGSHFRVKGLTTDPRSDLAVLRIEGEDFQPVQLGDLRTVKQGHFAIVMGNPFGSAFEGRESPTMSFGVISGLGQVLTHELDPLDQRYYGNLIQTDAPINPGNSGGLLINLEGKVIGLTTAIATRSGSSQGVGYAIAIDQRTKGIIERLAKGERVVYGYLGVRLRKPTASECKAGGLPEEGGALIQEVKLETPAADASLQAGDILYRFNGRRIETPDQLIRWVGAVPAGQKVRFLMYRDKTSNEIQVTLAKREVPAGSHYEEEYTCCGLTLADIDGHFRQKYEHLTGETRGVVVAKVKPGSRAEKAGLRCGQMISMINGKRLASVRPLHCGWIDKPLKLTLADESHREITLP